MKEDNSTYNDSSNRVHPIAKVVSQQCSNKANDVGDDIKKVVLCVSFDNLISKRAAIQNQKEFYNCHRQHNPNNPSFLLLRQVELTILEKVVEENMRITWQTEKKIVRSLKESALYFTS